MESCSEYFAVGGTGEAISLAEAKNLLSDALSRMGRLRRVLLIPPDFTRFHSLAGELTVVLHDLLRDGGTDVTILPALGTHAPMADSQITRMFPGVPKGIFEKHDWRSGLTHLGDVPSSFVADVSNGRVAWPIRCEINKLLVEESWDRIFSIGQLVPHEVAGIANHAKNIFVGTGGKDVIDRTHFLGAVCGMEAQMGRVDTPVRKVFNYMAREFAAKLPITYVMTVRERDAAGVVTTRGLYCGDGTETFEKGSALCRQVNVELLDRPVRKAVAWMDPAEFHSTWIGGKAVYRLRMAMADDGELVVVAPGVRMFGEDQEIDRLLRKYGYPGTEKTLELVKSDSELAANLSAAAHMIHGSTEGRFRVRWCAGGLSRREIEEAGFLWGDHEEYARRYDLPNSVQGWREVDDEEVFVVTNPAAGLWALSDRFLGAA